MKIDIVKASPTDYVELYESLPDDEWKEKSKMLLCDIKERENDVELCLIAKAQDEPIGFVYGCALPNKTLIPIMLYVVPNFRRLGVGKMLLENMEKLSNCEVSMIYYNKTLHHHYEKQGYVGGDELEVALKCLG